MGVLDVCLLLYFPFSGLYNKIHIHGVYYVTGRKLWHGEIVLLNLFLRRKLLYTGSNANEGVLQLPQISRSGVSPSDAI